MNANTHTNVVANDVVANDVIDNANEEMMMMYANANVVNTNTNTNANGVSDMRKISEMVLAESVVPMVFIEMHFNDYMESNTIAERQVVSAAIFKTLYIMGASTVSYDSLVCDLYDNIEYMCARNRDKVKGFRGGDVDIASVVEFMLSIKMIDRLGDLFFASDKFYEMTYKVVGRAPLLQGEERRVPYIKNEDSKPSELMKEAMDFLGATQFTVDKDMLRVIHAVKSKLPKLAIWKDSASMLSGADEMNSDEAYTTEIDADNRGRMYNVAHYGPNAQKDDINRSLVKLSVGSYVTPDSFEFKFMYEEFKDLVGKNAPELLTPAAMVAMHNSPTACLHKLLTVYASVTNPFSVVRLGGELGNVIKNNGAYMFMPAGLDAKCSGSQIYSILVGDYDMMASCGFSDRKVADPYERVAEIVKVARSTVKKPYMVVQYGGGLASLLADKEFIKSVPEDEEPNKYCKKVISAIEHVMGEKILRLRALIQAQVLAICNARNVESFKYSHIDGFVVNKTVCGKVDVTEFYSAIRYQQVDGVIDFGSKLEGTGIVDISDRVPSRDEFARTFAVNYIQGLDALIARKVAVAAKEAGLDGLVSIHDCFRVAPKDVGKLKGVIQQVYTDIFVYSNPLQHLFDQLDLDSVEQGFESVLTEDMIYEEGNYFFGL